MSLRRRETAPNLSITTGGLSQPAAIVAFDGRLVLRGGEVGFTPDTQRGDVWSSSDGGASWELVSEAPAGHQRLLYCLGKCIGQNAHHCGTHSNSNPEYPGIVSIISLPIRIDGV